MATAGAPGGVGWVKWGRLGMLMRDSNITVFKMFDRFVSSVLCPQKIPEGLERGY